MVIRKGRIEDIQGLVRCQISVWQSLHGLLPTSWVEEEMMRLHQAEIEEALLREINDPIRITIVGEEDTKIVGFVFGRINLWKVSQLRFMGVTPSHRNKGLGRSLIEEYLSQSKLKGAHKVSLNTSPSLKSAIQLYVDMGFIPEGLLRQHAHGMDIIIYSKFLT